LLVELPPKDAVAVPKTLVGFDETVVPKRFDVPPAVPDTDVTGFKVSRFTPDAGCVKPNNVESGPGFAVVDVGAGLLKSLVPPPGVNGMKLTIGRSGPLATPTKGFPVFVIGVVVDAELVFVPVVVEPVVVVGPVNLKSNFIWDPGFVAMSDEVVWGVLMLVVLVVELLVGFAKLKKELDGAGFARVVVLGTADEPGPRRDNKDPPVGCEIGVVSGAFCSPGCDIDPKVNDDLVI
jgi:hypothetical protein